MNDHLGWAKGGTASFVLVADDAVTLRSTCPFPPGSRVNGVLVGEVADVLRNVTIKIGGSKRAEDGSFTLRGKLLVASRAQRVHLASLVAPAP